MNSAFNTLNPDRNRHRAASTPLNPFDAEYPDFPHRALSVIGPAPTVQVDHTTGNIADVTALSSIRVVLTRHQTAYTFGKRVFDIVLAVLLIVLLSPIWITAALLVRLTSDGHILYKQQRVGKDGRAFRCLKFQTMVPDAHAMKMELDAFNEASGPVFKLKRDPRVTPLGRRLRKMSIDEMPQLINVLRGEMSIVGPRPPLPDEVAYYTARQLGRLAVTPGMTCLWQVSGRSHIGFEEWVELDLKYIRRRSFWYDLWLIVLTIPAVISGRGAF